MTKEMEECRVDGHTYTTVRFFPDPVRKRLMHKIEVCTHCQTKRDTLRQASGKVISRTYNYPQGATA